MPIKLKESAKRYDRQTKKTTIEHHYMKCQSVDTLVKEFESCLETDSKGRVVTKKGKGRLKHKVLNELVRREVKPYKTHFKVARSK